MDGENRIARTALQLGIDVNNATINVRDSEVLPESLQAEFNDLWQDWFHRSDDLFWNRNDRIYKRIVNQIEDGRVEREDVRWDRRRDRYPELPVGTIFFQGENPAVYGGREADNSLTFHRRLQSEYPTTANLY